MAFVVFEGASLMSPRRELDKIVLLLLLQLVLISSPRREFDNRLSNLRPPFPSLTIVMICDMAINEMMLSEIVTLHIVPNLS